MADSASAVHLGPELVQHLFPFYIAFDHELKVTHFGRAVSKICQNISVGLPLLEIFSVWRPKGKVTFQSFQQQLQATFLFDSVTTKIRMRGQMVIEPQLNVLLFIGSPWFTDIEHLQKTDLQLKDFTVHDPIVDFLYMVQAKALALQDAKQFSETVIKQRDELEQTNKELERASAAKSQFLANTSHELRTPLNGIIGMTTLLTRGTLLPQQKNCVDKVLRSAKALLVVVNDVLDFSKIEAGKLTLEPVDFDLQQLMFDVVELFAVAAQAKGVDLVCNFAPEVPITLHGDPGRIRQIVSNLIGNAVKFTDQGDITLSVSRDASVATQGSAQPEGVMLHFDVIDTGIGIDPKDQSALFSAFSQVDGSMTRKHGGTGLGLAISKNLAGLMGGTTGLKSEVGKGSTFWFSACLKTAAEVDAPAREPDLIGQRVLVVDDSAACRLHLSSVLSRSGALVVCAADAIQGMEALRAASTAGTPYAMALIDAKMPRLSGFDLRMIIAGDPALDGLRTVVLTSLDQEMQGDALRERARFDASLTKPLRSGSVLDCLVSLMQTPGVPAPVIQALVMQVPVTQAPIQAPVVKPPQPVAAPVPLQSVALDTAAAAMAAPMRERRVLVVDDHPVNQEVASQMVESMGYRVDIAGNGREAVNAHFKAPYDIILTDLQMPEMDGYEETKEIRAREGTAERTPIIAMTAHAMAKDRTRALDIGLDDYIAKPIDFDKLVSLLKLWVPLDGDSPAEIQRVKTTSAAASALAVATPPVQAAKAPPAIAAPPPAIDRSVLDQLRRYQKPGAPDLVADVVKKFLGDLPDRVQAVQMASADGDSIAVTKPAHALKSSSAMVGALRFSEICSDLEERCQTESLEQVADLLSQFQSECARVRTGLSALLAESAAAPPVPFKTSPSPVHHVS